MRLVTCEVSGENRLAAQSGGWLIDLVRAQQVVRTEYLKPPGQSQTEDRLPGEMVAFLRAGQAALDAASELVGFLMNQLQSDRDHLRERKVLLSLEEIAFRPPVTHPGKILCVGMNYPSPRKPASKPEYPVIFLKLSSTLNGHHQPVILPPFSQEVVFEGELAVIIGKPGYQIPRDQTMQYVAGFTIANDLSASDLERRSSQWATGKLPATFTPLGPALVTCNEVPDPGALRISSYCNHELVQQGYICDMYFDVEGLVSYLSSIVQLEPGDLILTGSPKAIGGTPAPRVFLSPGDQVEVEIEGLGVLSNPVVAQE